MKIIASRLKDREFDKHLDDMQLYLFSQDRLNKEDRDEVFKHLSECKRCRDVLKTAKEIEEMDKGMKPVNNINYKSYLKVLSPLVASVLIFFVVPEIDKPPISNIRTKGIIIKQPLLDKNIEYWSKLFKKLIKRD